MFSFKGFEMKLPVEIATTRRAGFDASEIGQPVSGPLESLDSDEPWMGDHFTQENFEQLQDAQEAGEVGPPLDLAKYARFAEGDTAGFEKWLKTQPQDVQDDWAANKEKYRDQFKTASGKQELRLRSGWTLRWNPAQNNRMDVEDPDGTWSDEALLVKLGKVLYDFPERIPAEVRQSVLAFFKKVRKSVLPTDFTYTIDIDERGEFRATVYGPDDREVLEIDDSIFEDGYMRHKNDLRGLAEYLEVLKIGGPGTQVRTASIKTAAKSPVSGEDIAKMEETLKVLKGLQWLADITPDSKASAQIQKDAEALAKRIENLKSGKKASGESRAAASKKPTAAEKAEAKKLKDNPPRTASLPAKKIRVPLAVRSGEPPVVDAIAVGPLAVHKGDRGGWVLSFAPEIEPGGDREPAIAMNRAVPSQKNAMLLLNAIVEGVPAIMHARNQSDVIALKNQLAGIILDWNENAGRTNAAPRLVGTREKVRGWLEEAGLRNLGSRYGKAGEFYGVKGLSKVISLGKRDLLLNQFNVTNYGYRLGENWVLDSAELLSAVTPELVATWARLVKQSPTMIEVRNGVREKGSSQGVPLALSRPITARYHEGPEGEREFQEDLEAGVYPESFEDSWDENTDKYGDQFKTASFALTRADRSVLNAFLGQQAASGNKLDTDGVTLDGLWMGGRGIASWHMGKIEFHDLGSRVAQQIQRVISSMAPAAWVKKASVNIDAILSTLSHGRLGKDDFPEMDDLSLAEAIYCYCADYHEGVGSREYRCLSDLKAGGFRPGPNLSARRLDSEGQYVYEQLGGEI